MSIQYHISFCLNLRSNTSISIFESSIGSIMLVDSGAAYTSVNESMKLKNLRKVSNTRLEYADGSVGAEIKTKGDMILNEHNIPAYMSPDLSQNLLSTDQRSLSSCL